MKPVFVLSMLHEKGSQNAATRCFRGEPVLRRVTRRLARVRVPVLVGGEAEQANGAQVAVLVWSDQVAAATAAVEQEGGIRVFDLGPRQRVEVVEAVATALRWVTGWRGGPLHTCHFDRGYWGTAVARAVSELGGDAAVIVDASAGLLDPELVSTQLEHAVENPEKTLVFNQAAPGLGTVFLQRQLVEELARTNSYPGKGLTYVPGAYASDPIGTKACSMAPTIAVRTLQRFTLDTPQQIARLEAATAHLPDDAGAEVLVEAVNAYREVSSMPHEVVIELTPRRHTRAVFRPSPATRDEMPVESWISVLDQLVGTGTRVLLAGGGDPFLYAQLPEFLEAARDREIPVAMETDLQSVQQEMVQRVAGSDLDILLVHLPAISQGTYARMMGGGELSAALTSLQRFLDVRAGRSTPLVVPVFTKTKLNQGEMEGWYDHWLMLLGSAVIDGASSYAGQIESVAVADLAPATRIPCRRLMDRVTILSDGNAVSCEFDVFSKQSVGNVSQNTVEEIWRSRLERLRVDHREGKFALNVLCSNCSEWHRP